LLYFTTNFCELTFSIGLPPVERVGLTTSPFSALRNANRPTIGGRVVFHDATPISTFHIRFDAWTRPPMREAPIIDLLAIMLWLLAVLGLVL